MIDQRREDTRNQEDARIRLNKYLSELGVCSRREADCLIEEGKVLVDGKAASKGMKIFPGQRIVCDGTIISDGEHQKEKPKPVLLAVNKPRGVVCTTSKKDQAVNIVELVKYPERVYPIGRLDKDSEGLILMTNQGDLVNKIMRASNAHEKEYVVTIDKPVTKEFIKNMCAGVWLEELGVATRPCQVECIGRKEFRIVLTQGLNRQIRRMCQVHHCHVTQLKRVRVMNITLGNLMTGTFRRVTGEEYEKLMEMLEQSTNLPYEKTEDMPYRNKRNQGKYPSVSPFKKEPAKRKPEAKRPPGKTKSGHIKER